MLHKQDEEKIKNKDIQRDSYILHEVLSHVVRASHHQSRRRTVNIITHPQYVLFIKGLLLRGVQYDLPELQVRDNCGL